MTGPPVLRKINRKIPGTLLPPAKAEIDGKITDITFKTIPELLELRDRQLKLLNNKAFIYKLPDKGVKIQELHDKIISELKSKQEEERTCKLLENMKIDLGQETVQDIEWEGRVNTNRHEYLDSDDDSEPEDVLRILSQTNSKEKTVKVLQPERPLITTEDLEKIGELSHIRYIVEKTEQKPNPKATGHFKPHKTTKSDVHDPKKEILRKKHKNWEVTAATPPPSIHGPVKVLSLEESLKLQKDFNVHLKEMEAKHAAEKLLAQSGIKMSELPKDVSGFGNYRDVGSGDSELSDNESDKEVYDEEPERGGVVFTVMK